MSYYICACGARFAAPKTVHIGGERLEPDYEVCPRCGQGEYDEYEDCARCGQPVPTDTTLPTADEYLCPDCSAQLIKNARGVLHHAFSMEDIEHLNKILLQAQDDGDDIII